MNIEIRDDCWGIEDLDWKRSLARLLVALEERPQHAVLADDALLAVFCRRNLPLSQDVLLARVAASNPRSRALNLVIAPEGERAVHTDPPWVLQPSVAADLVEEPLSLVLENDQSDLGFLEAVSPEVLTWRSRRYLRVEMGGGAAMSKRIERTAVNAVTRWRSFFLFDSDRLHPDELEDHWRPPGGDQCQGHQFELAARQLPPRRAHRLARRSIENYIPLTLPALAEKPAAVALTTPQIGRMVNFFNMKAGLTGDGIHPVNPKLAVKAARSKGFWSGLAPDTRDALQVGFGPRIADSFQFVSPTHPWPPDIRAEVATLLDALQDAL